MLCRPESAGNKNLGAGNAHAIHQVTRHDRTITLLRLQLLGRFKLGSVCLEHLVSYAVAIVTQALKFSATSFLVRCRNIPCTSC